MATAGRPGGGRQVSATPRPGDSAMTTHPATANAVIEFYEDGFDTGGKRLMGRHAAGEGFLRGFARHGAVDRFVCCAREQEAFDQFRSHMLSADRGLPIAHIGPEDFSALSQIGCLYRADPGIADFAWKRRFADQRGFSLCGITHTTASARVMESISSWLVAPVQSWDAMICTSIVVQKTILSALESWRDYLQDRMGAAPRAPLQLPVIPLGVDCDRFAPNPEARARLRASLGAADDHIVVLFVGRLSFHAKAHPVATYMALETIAQTTGKSIHFVQAGWFANKHIESEFVSDARALCPNVHTVFWDGRDSMIRRDAWHAADILVSLSDNIQETFGLVPIEAMAAGLPVVVSDWNGYRDTVRPGIDGFRVKTHMPAAGLGDGFAFNHLSGRESYDRYIGSVSQTTAVNVGEATEALQALATNPDLRQRMGAAGRARTRAEFDWRHIIRRYQELWKELAERRVRDTEIAPRKSDAHPHHRDPYALFANYPTSQIDRETLITLAPSGSAARLSQLRKLGSLSFASGYLSEAGDCETALRFLETCGPCTADTLLTSFAPDKRAAMHRTIGWLAKLDLVRIETEDSFQPSPPPEAN